MKTTQIYSYKNQTLLHEGEFENISACIEDAINKDIDLSYSNLRNLNLSNINLDDAQMPFADFSGSNLTGANMSEGMLRGALFRNTALYNTCFAYADLQGCDFTEASFGATDITGCNISFSVFSALSCFTLEFTHARLMKDCIFINDNHGHSKISQPPIVVKGLSKKPIIMMDHRILHGRTSYNYAQMFLHLNRLLSVRGRHFDRAHIQRLAQT